MMRFIVLVADVKQSVRGVFWSPGDSMELPVGPLGGSPHPGIQETPCSCCRELEKFVQKVWNQRFHNGSE